MIASLILALGIALPAPWVQAKVGKPDGYVTDRAGLFSDSDRRNLNEQAEAYAKGTGLDVAVLTIQSLEGQSPEQFALEVARGWKLGKKGLNDGVLLLIDVGERKIRIEVGRGLEGDLTDLYSSRIIREILNPAFAKEDYFGGVERALETMQAIIGGESAPPNLEQGKHKDGGQFYLFGGLMLLFLLRMRRGGGRGPGGRGMRRAGPLIFMPLGGGFGSGGGGGGGGFGGFGGGGGFSGGGASGGW